MIAEAGEVGLQALGLHQPLAWRIVDHEMGKVRLAGDRADGGEFRRHEARQVQCAGVRVLHTLQLRLFRALRLGGLLAELAEVLVDRIIRHWEAAPGQE